ncbi:hypothetical protein WT83_16655 [Burkholderia territorii]|uniref:Fis family transcriptional regulator n=2 Tax=Burkholderia territorii TaxID=1503055 RepID=A0A119VJB3_9BURK|nr:hypothetical protein WT83_16655 [Burkholderia territorii]
MVMSIADTLSTTLSTECMFSSQKKLPAMLRRSAWRYPMTHFSPAQLMPMCAARVRVFSLAHRLALLTLRNGQVDMDALVCLFSAIGAARILHETQHGPETAQQASFEFAWDALLRCLVQVREGQTVIVNEADVAMLDPLLTLHDTQMTATPAHELLAAQRQLARYLSPCMI